MAIHPFTIGHLQFSQRLFHGKPESSVCGRREQGVDRLLLRFCEIGKRGYLLALKIGYSFMWFLSKSR
jgi:hypothetical protein